MLLQVEPDCELHNLDRNRTIQLSASQVSLQVLYSVFVYEVSYLNH